ncbi:FAD binding domain-containing protein [Sinomonas sp. RB5]
MDMTSVEEVLMSADPDQWLPGDSWLAGGTVLLSYGTDITRGRPRRLLDLTGAGWQPVLWDADGNPEDAGHQDAGQDAPPVPALELAATCRVAEVYALPEAADLPLPRDLLPGLDLFRPCCDSFVASYKIWNVSTVGGNVATALPAGPMTSLLAGLDAVAVLLGPGGARRELPVADFVLGETRTALRDGELIRCFRIPLAALRQPSAFRRISLTERGRSAALLIGRCTGPGRIRIVVTASTRRPLVVDLGGAEQSPATGEGWRSAIDAAVADKGWHDDVHGAPDWRRAMTHRLGEEILAELLPGAPAAARRTTGDITMEGTAR